MKRILIFSVICFVLLTFCSCADDTKSLNSDNVTSFSTATEEREYWLTKNDYPPEYNSSGETIQTFKAVVDNKTYLEYFEVIIRHDVSLKGYEFTIEDFKGVENISSIGASYKVMSEEKYKQHNNGSYEEYYNNYHQEITIYPKERTIEKVRQMVSQLKELPFIKDVAFYEKGSGIDCAG